MRRRLAPVIASQEWHTQHGVLQTCSIASRCVTMSTQAKEQWNEVSKDPCDGRRLGGSPEHDHSDRTCCATHAARLDEHADHTAHTALAARRSTVKSPEWWLPHLLLCQGVEYLRITTRWVW